MASDSTLKIQFIQACTPPLETGDYEITVTQDVTAATDKAPIPEHTSYFSIKGPRFTLDPDDIYSVFPPENHHGHYDTCLPHVVFSRKTLPWERTLDGKPPSPAYDPAKPDTVPPPWLALLSFSADEAPKPQSVTLNDLCAPPKGILSPSFTLDSWEDGNSTCLVIDVPTSLFSSIAPKKSELPFLAHARSTENGEFGVVVGNRFPLSSMEGKKNTMHLVSFERFEDYLPGGSSAADLKNYTAVRLVTLRHWSYTDITEPYDFKKLVNDLDIGSMEIPAGGVSQSEVVQAFSLGYTALNHNNRKGEQSISWYRGPFVPQEVDYTTAGTVYSCADGALRYDPATGMFDISYASAWQLGLLLALQNRNYASALYRWRRANKEAAASKVTRDTVCDATDNFFSTTSAEGIKTTRMNELMVKYFKDVLGKKLVPALGGGEPLLGAHADPTGLKKIKKETSNDE